MTRGSRKLEQRLFREMVARIKETDLSVPELQDGYYYYTRTVKGQQYPIFCRKRGSLSAREEVLLDENLLGRGRAYSHVGVRQVSPDGRLLAFTHDTTGSEWYTVRVKDLRSGRLLPDAIDSVSYGLEWAADNRTLFFTRDNAAHRPDRIFRRALGSPTESMVVSEPDSLYFLALGKTKDRAYLLATSSSFTTGEVRYLPSDQPAAAWRVLLPRREGIEYSAEHHGRRLPGAHQRRRGELQGHAGAHGVARPFAVDPARTAQRLGPHRGHGRVRAPPRAVSPGRRAPADPGVPARGRLGRHRVRRGLPRDRARLRSG